MTTTNIIKNYESILNAVQGMFQTNMKTDEITALIQMQINDMTKWDVQTTLLDGTGDMYQHIHMEARHFMLCDQIQILSVLQKYL